MEEIRFPRLEFDSPLAAAIIELERSRAALAMPTELPPLFAELRELFQRLTSMMSARIEGNRTTVVDALAGAAQAEAGRVAIRDDVREILRLDQASDYIDGLPAESFVITHELVRELHGAAVRGLGREGDRTPGMYRTTPVVIAGSPHVPPGPESVYADMDQLVEFMNRDVAPQMQLMQTAIAHHRFVWLHPFGNGNGRVARLLTYAMLVKQGFTAAGGYRALNPTAVFGADRQAYYDHLARADALDDGGIIEWCTYVLGGVQVDLEHIRRLGDPTTVLDEVYVPALDHAHRSGVLDGRDIAVLTRIAGLGQVRAGMLEDLLPGSPAVRSQQLRKLLDRRFIQRPAPTARSYRIKLVPNDLTIFVVRRLDELGLLPSILHDD